MMRRCFDVIQRLQGSTLATAESCTGGGIGAALTSVSGSSAVYLGGIVSYTNRVKEELLDVPEAMLETFGAVSAPVAEAMASGVRKKLGSDIAVSVTGLAGPSGDDYGNRVGTVYIGYSDKNTTFARQYLFEGGREEVRDQAIDAALDLILEQN